MHCVQRSVKADADLSISDDFLFKIRCDGFEVKFRFMHYILRISRAKVEI